MQYIEFPVAALLLVLLSTGPARTESSPGDDKITTVYADSASSVFLELHLSPDGVYGVDSQGTEWEYDFSQGKFILQGDAGNNIVTEIVVPNPVPPDIDSLMAEAEKARIKMERIEINQDSMANDMEETALRALKKIRGLQLGTVEIGPDDIIVGPLVAVGPITVKGTVKGDVISFRKITVTSTGEITGDARAPEIVKMRGAIIGGDQFETDLPKIPEIEIFETTSDTALIANLIILAVLLFCGLLAVAIVPASINRLEKCLQKYFLRSFFIGFAAWVLIGPLFALLCLTIIGIPVAFFVLPLALILGVILGSIGLGQLVGRALNQVLGKRLISQLLRVILGIIVLYIPWIIMSLFMRSTSGLSEAFSTLFLVLSIVIWSIGVTAGLGTVVMTRFGSRECEKAVKLTVEVSGFYPPPPPTPPPLKGDEETSKGSSEGS